MLDPHVKPPREEAKPSSPVRWIPADEERGKPESGLGLCLSGGGYRAMLFHVGALWRLNELGYLPQLKRISSVSGGSITAGVLGHALGQARVRRTGRRIAGRGEPGRGGRRADPRSGRRRRSTRARSSAACSCRGHDQRPGRRGLRQHLFGDATLQDLPDAAALRHQRDQRAVGRAVALLQALHAPTTGSGGPRTRGPLADRGRGLLGVPADTVAVARCGSTGRPSVAGRRATTCSARRFTTEVVAHRRRRLRQPRAGDGLEELQDGPGQRRRRHDGRRTRSPGATGRRTSVRVTDVIDNQVRSLRKRQSDRRLRAPEETRTGWPTGGSAATSPTRARRRACLPVRADARAGRDADPPEAAGRGDAGAADQLGLRDLRRRDAEMGRRDPATPSGFPYPDHPLNVGS